LSSITVVLNPASGGVYSPRIASDIADLFHANGRDARIVVLEQGKSATDVARAASGPGSIVVAAGGDGTVSCVAAGIFGTPAILGVLPIGTLNHFAKDLHIPLDLGQAVGAIATGHTTRIDVGQVNDRVFINNSSIGVYPSIVEGREELRRHGYRKWPAMALATFRVLRRYRGVHVRLVADGRPSVWRTPIVFIGNNEYTLEGIHLGTRARLDEGRLYVYIAPRVRARDLPLLVARAIAGRAKHHGDFTIAPASELWIETTRRRRVRVAIDGEVTKMTTPLHYRTRPDSLPVIVPHG
jgi:diacylglycerol kinase family enzyme